MTHLSNYYTSTVEFKSPTDFRFFQVFLKRFFLFCTAIGFVSFSANASDFFSARTAGLGGAGHAGPLLNDAIYLNPAFIPYTPADSISFQYTKERADAPTTSPYRGATSTKAKHYTISFVDGRNELVQGGFAYTRRADAKIIHLVFAKQLIREFSVGITGKAFSNRQPGLQDHMNVGVSAAYLPTSNFQVALVGNNLVSNKIEASKARDVYPEFVLGTKIILQQILMLYADPNYTPSHPDGDIGFNLGAEIAVMKDFFLRTGTFRKSHIPFERTRGAGFGLGAGWIAPKLSIDYAYTRIRSPRAAFTHQLGMTVYF